MKSVGRVPGKRPTREPLRVVLPAQVPPTAPAVAARFPVLDAERPAAGAWRQRTRPQNLREGLTVTGRGPRLRLPL